MITEHLLARGATVCLIMGPGNVTMATLTCGALVRDGEVIYPHADAAWSYRAPTEHKGEHHEQEIQGR